MDENNSVFRQKSLDRISSPEDLDKYIKTTTPSLWLLLLAVIVFLGGIIVWGVVGKLETSSPIGCKVSSNGAVCYIKEEDVELITEGSYVEIDGEKYEISNVGDAKEADENTDSYMLHNSEISDGGWYAEVKFKANITNGNYKAKIVYELISPIKFVLN